MISEVPEIEITMMDSKESRSSHKISAREENQLRMALLEKEDNHKIV